MSGRRDVEPFFAARSIIPGGRDVAAKWGEIVAYAVKRGRPRPFNDSWIAASCLTYDLSLATLNIIDSRTSRSSEAFA